MSKTQNHGWGFGFHSQKKHLNSETALQLHSLIHSVHLLTGSQWPSKLFFQEG